MTHHRSGLLSLCALTLFLLTSPAGAATITYGVSSAGGEPGLVPRFNPSLGTLDSVEVVATANASFDTDFRGQPGATIHATLTVPFLFRLDAGGPTFDATRTLDFTLNSAGFFHVYESVSRSVDFAARPEQFLGTGYTQFGISDYPFWRAPGATAFIEGRGSVYGGGTVTYTYTPAVPEPASLVMLATGLVGVGLTAARRRLTSSRRPSYCR